MKNAKMIFIFQNYCKISSISMQNFIQHKYLISEEKEVVSCCVKNGSNFVWYVSDFKKSYSPSTNCYSIPWDFKTFKLLSIKNCNLLLCSIGIIMKCHFDKSIHLYSNVFDAFMQLTIKLQKSSRDVTTFRQNEKLYIFWKG